MINNNLFLYNALSKTPSTQKRPCLPQNEKLSFSAKNNTKENTLSKKGLLYAKAIAKLMALYLCVFNGTLGTIYSINAISNADGKLFNPSQNPPPETIEQVLTDISVDNGLINEERLKEYNHVDETPLQKDVLETLEDYLEAKENFKQSENHSLETTQDEIFSLITLSANGSLEKLESVTEELNSLAEINSMREAELFHEIDPPKETIISEKRTYALAHPIEQRYHQDSKNNNEPIFSLRAKTAQDDSPIFQETTGNALFNQHAESFGAENSFIHQRNNGTHTYKQHAKSIGRNNITQDSPQGNVFWQKATSTNGNILQISGLFQEASSHNGAINQLFDHITLPSEQQIRKYAGVLSLVKQDSASYLNVKQDMLIRESSGLFNNTVEQNAPNATNSVQSINIYDSNSLSVKQTGSPDKNTFFSYINSTDSVTIEQNANAGRDFLDVDLTNTSHSVVSLKGGDGNDNICLKLENAVNTSAYLFGNTDSTIDTEMDLFSIRLDDDFDTNINNNKNNHIYINDGISGEQNDRVTLKLPSNIDLEKDVLYDPQTNTITVDNNVIHLGNTVKTVLLRSDVLVTKDEYKTSILNDPRYTEEEKQTKLENMKLYIDTAFMDLRTNQRLIGINVPPLPEAINPLIINKTGVQEELNDFIITLKLIYSDPEGKLLIDKLIENQTTMELVNEKDIDNGDGSRAAYFLGSDNKIVFISQKDEKTILHEIGHSIVNDDVNAIEEEIGTDVLASEISARINGKELSDHETLLVAKNRLAEMIDENTQTEKKYRKLIPYNGFQERIQEETGATINVEFDPLDLYDTLMRERPGSNPNDRVKRSLYYDLALAMKNASAFFNTNTAK